MAEISIALVASIYIIMKVTERILKDFSHKKTLKQQDFDAEIKRFEKSMKIGQENFNIITEEIRDLKAKYEEIKDLQLGSARGFGGPRL